MKAKTILVKNPMVLPIAIGEYDTSPDEPEEELVDVKLKQLPGVRVDIDNVIKTLSAGLNYDIHPDYSSDDCNSYRIRWTEQEVVDFNDKVRIEV